MMSDQSNNAFNPNEKEEAIFHVDAEYSNNKDKDKDIKRVNTNL